MPRVLPELKLPAVAALAVAHAVLFAAAFPTLDLWPLTLVSVAPLAWLALAARSLRPALLVVLVTQTAMWLWINRWVAAVTAAGYPLMCVYLALYAVAFVALLRFVAGRPRLARWPCVVTVPVIWVGLEFLRGRVALDGYPWCLSGHPMAHWPIAVQSADLLGGYFVSFLAVSVSGLIVDALRARLGGLPARTAAVAAAAVAAAFAADLAYGVWRVNQATTGPGPIVLAIQSNLPQSNKIARTPEQEALDFISLIELTDDAAEAAAEAGVRPDLVAWPETMFPGFGLEPQTVALLRQMGFDQPAVFGRELSRLQGRIEAPLLVGSAVFTGLRVEGERWAWDAHYNSAYLVWGFPPFERYDKHFLTPFGETMPYISRWPWLEQKLMAIGAGGMSFDLDSGPRLNRIELPRPDGSTPWSMATPICFEVTVGHVCRAMVYPGGSKRADLLVNLSNDGWFGGSDAGRWAHAQIARFRCIENRVPMIRCVNTGVSIAFDSAGRIISPLEVTGGGRAAPPRQAGWVLAELPTDRRSTVYGRIGDLWGWSCLLGAAGLLALAAACRRWEVQP